MKEEFIDCCNDCGQRRYAEFKPLREIGGITISMTECELCKGANVKKRHGVVPASDWMYMCRKTEEWD